MIFHDISIPFITITHRRVLTAIECLTKQPNESYVNYLKRVKKNKMARLVKLADINDNMSVERLSYLPIHNVLKMVCKYWTAMRYLRSIDSEKTIENISYEQIIVDERQRLKG